MADITAPRNLNPRRRHRSYPRVLKRHRHSRYRLKQPTDTGTRYPGPATIKITTHSRAKITTEARPPTQRQPAPSKPPPIRHRVPTPVSINKLSGIAVDGLRQPRRGASTESGCVGARPAVSAGRSRPSRPAPPRAPPAR